MISNILSFSGDDKPNDLNQTETSSRSEPKLEKLSESTNLRSTEVTTGAIGIYQFY